MGITENDYELLVFGLIPVGRIEHEWWNSTTMVYGYLCTIFMLLFSGHVVHQFTFSNSKCTSVTQCGNRETNTRMEITGARKYHRIGQDGDATSRPCVLVLKGRQMKGQQQCLSLTSAGARISHSSWSLFPATSSHQTPLLLGGTSAKPAGCWNLIAVQRHNSKPNQWHTQDLHILTTEKYQIQNVRSNSAYTEVLTKVDE